MKSKTKRKIKFHLIRGLNFFFMIIPLKKNKVLFLSDQRDVLGGNLKCLYDSVDKEKYNKVLILKANNLTKRSKKDVIKLLYHITTSKYILLDDWNKTICMITRRKKQEIVQLWHGPGAFKTFGFSRIDRSKKINKYTMHRNYTKAIVTSDKIRWCYAEGFGMDISNVRATGFPRTDCFFDEKYVSNIKKSFYDEYKEFKNKKIILFAPTYRGVNLAKATYDFDKIDFDKMYNELKDDYILIVKWHPAIYDKIKLGKIKVDYSKYKDFIYDFSDKRDINDILLITDVLVTDYSSVIFDYFLLDKPVVYYTYDLEEYKKERGLYYPFEDYVYGEITENTNQLIKAIKNPKMDEDKRDKFNDLFMEACDGKSTEKTYDYIFKE